MRYKHPPRPKFPRTKGGNLAGHTNGGGPWRASYKLWLIDGCIIAAQQRPAGAVDLMPHVKWSQVDARQIAAILRKALGCRKPARPVAAAARTVGSCRGQTALNKLNRAERPARRGAFQKVMLSHFSQFLNLRFSYFGFFKN